MLQDKRLLLSCCAVSSSPSTLNGCLGRPVANLLPSREDSRSIGMETPIHVCLTSEHAFMVLPKRRLLAAFAVDEVVAGVLSREDRNLYGDGDEINARDVFLRSRIARIADDTAGPLAKTTSQMHSAESSGLTMSSGRAAGNTRGSRRAQSEFCLHDRRIALWLCAHRN